MKTKALLSALIVTTALICGTGMINFPQNIHVHDTLHTSDGPTKMAGEILVQFKPGTKGSDIAALHARHGASEIASSRFSGVKRLKISPRKTIDEMVAIYQRNPNVDYAEPNFIAHAQAPPNDPLYNPYQWHFDNIEYGGIEMEAAWDTSSGHPDIIVAVLDSGVAYEDYDQYVAINKRRGYWINYLQAPDLAQTNFVAGYDFINDDSHANDDEGHGTHVTGTIAQSSNNYLGTAGIAFNTSIMPVKVLDSNGSGSYSAIADGIYFATDNGAKVINMSLGGGSPSITLENALAYAYNNDVTIVCASGNDGYTNSISYPAAYDAYCIAVGASRYDEAISYYSNQGASLDITAPGGDINIDQNGDGYGDGVLQQTFGSDPTDFGYYFYQGTSMATPHVAAVAALLLAQDDTRSADDIRQILQTTAKDRGASGWDAGYGWGILDAAAALNYAAVPNSIPIANISAPTTANEESAVLFDGSSSYDNDGDPLTYRWDFGDGTNGSGITTSHSYVAGGDYTVSLIVNDGKIDSAAATMEISITEINDPPVADAGADKSAVVGQQLTFDAGGSFDSDDGIASYLWEFGDGNTASSEVTSHSYTASGSFDVTLTVTDFGNLTASDQLSVVVTTAPESLPLHAEIDLSLSNRRAGKNTFVKAIANLLISDAGTAVEGVIVTGQWLGSTEQLSRITTSNGQVSFESVEIKNPDAGTVFSFTIIASEKAGYERLPQGEITKSIIY